MSRCAFVRPDGRRCGLRAQREATFCFWHDPTKRERVAAARRATWANRQRRERHTPRQVQALRAYVAAGSGYVGAARRLDTSEASVQSRVRRLRVKMGVATTEQLIYLGAIQGWLDVPEVVDRSRT